MGRWLVIGCLLVCTRASADPRPEAERLDEEFDAALKAGDCAAARSAGEREVALWASERGFFYAFSLWDVADADSCLGDAASAAAGYASALQILDADPDVPDRSRALLIRKLGEATYQNGDYATALQLLLRALPLAETAFGADAAELTWYLRPLGIAYVSLGDYAAAHEALDRALAIGVAKLSDAEETAMTQGNLGQLLQAEGRYAEAAEMLESAMATLGRALGYTSDDRSEEVLTSLLGADRVAFTIVASVAVAYVDMGELVSGTALFEYLLQVAERAFPKDDPLTVTTMNNLAGAYQDVGDTRCLALYERALEIQRRRLPAGHPDLAIALTNLGGAYGGNGEPDRGTPLLEEALAIREQALGPTHPDVAVSLFSLATNYRWRGDLTHADLLERALDIFEQVLGPDHERVGDTIWGLALLAAANGDVASELAWRTRLDGIREHTLDLMSATGSEAQKLAYLATLGFETWQTLDLHLQRAPDDARAARLALTTILRRKGRALDATTDTLRVLAASADPDIRAQLDDLRSTRVELATLTLRGPGPGQTLEQHRDAIGALAAAARALEQQLGRRYAALRGAHEPVTIEQVQAALGADDALVEITTYLPTDAQTGKLDDPEYVAYVLTASGDPRGVRLGSATEINDAILALQRGLADPTASYEAAARALDALVWRPIDPLLGDARRVYVAPEGALSLVPLGALVDEHGDFLIDRYQLVYLTSGRDLLRGRDEPRAPAMVIAAPSYADGTSDLHFDLLPGTVDEADAIEGLLGKVTSLRGANATEAALAAAQGPRLLHIATHGFFLDDLPSPTSEATRGIQARRKAAAENPLLRSGLALAGANARDDGAGNDGILTALEAANLDLHGTKLVVLSACDTGVGDVVNGDGVYGLRRAFVVAGAETVVMSLWQVDDTATKNLMVGYYQRLVAGEGRVEAMRQVQLAMMRDPKTAHPYYWASFVVSGNPDTLDGQAAPLPQFGRGARGCGCATSTPGASAVLVLVVLGTLRRRRR